MGVDSLGFLLRLPETTFELSLIGLSEQLGKPGDLFDRYKSYYWTKEPGLQKMYLGINDLLEEFAGRDVPLALVTQKARSFK